MKIVENPIVIANKKIELNGSVLFLYFCQTHLLHTHRIHEIGFHYPTRNELLSGQYPLMNWQNSKHHLPI